VQIPRVNPVGLMEQPADYRTRPRRQPAATRLAALAILLAFASVSISTTVLTLGAYCLTTDATTPAPLAGR
jgi:hypothetical protein